MTTEDDFNSALDANPEDWQTRLVYADWLQERSDPRAEGYRALGVRRVRPVSVQMAVPPWYRKRAWVYGHDGNNVPAHQRHCLLAADWFDLIERSEGCDDTWRRRLKRREAEDAAAFAFGKLAPEHRIELLSAPPSEDKARPKKRKKAARKKPTAPKPKAKKPKGKKK